MKNQTLGKLTQTSNLVRNPKPVAEVRTVARLSRLSSIMEPLESRTMMSVAHTPVVAVKAPVKVKTVALTLAVPTAAKATATSPNLVAVTWSEGSSTATGYKVLRSAGGGPFAQVDQTTSASTLSYTDTSVVGNITYIYKVEAYNNTATSTASATATVKTPLIAPAGLAAAALSGTSIKLTWSDIDRNATGYEVYRSIDGTHYTAYAALTGASVATYTDTAVTSGKAYEYEVQATSSANSSAISASATGITPLNTPSGLSASAQSSTTINLAWTNNDSGATGYNILRSTNGTSFSNLTTLSSATANTYADKSALPFTKYYYEVQATNSVATSGVSGIASGTTPLAIPGSVAAAAASPTSVKITWTDSDPAAQGYIVLKSTSGGSFTSADVITSGKTTSWTDNSVAMDTSYSYEIEATNGSTVSTASSAAVVTTPMSAPINLSATANSATSVTLTWTDVDSTATSYVILRSTDGQTFTTLKTISGGTTTTYTDSTVNSATTYYYKVEATNTYTTSSASDPAHVTTALLAPASLSATVVGMNINLAWTDKDSTATGYTLLRSTDGINFSTLTTLSSASANSYVDTSATAGQKYYYQVKATNSTLTSGASNTVNATVAAPTTNGVTIATRNTNELTITAAGKTDSISVSQSGSTLTIVADGVTTTQAAPAAGLFIYTRGGTDRVYVDSSVTVCTTVETIDTGVDEIDTQGSDVSVWDDSTDIYTGDGTVHSVASFAGGVAKTTGAALADPKDAGTTMKMTGSLWGTGPIAADVNQGAAGDCYFLSSLAAFAGLQPSLLQQSAVDMGDGTYTVQFISNGTPKFVRVSNDISTYGGGSYKFARPGSDGDLWAVVMEKAFCDFRTGANTYSSINSGFMGEVYADLGVNSTWFTMSSTNATTFFNTVSTALSDNNEVTLGTFSSPPDLVGGHAYTLISATMVDGVASYVVRNPWGVQGDSIENSQGYATLTFAQMQSNFYDCCVAT